MGQRYGTKLVLAGRRFDEISHTVNALPEIPTELRTLVTFEHEVFDTHPDLG
jgi:hypothetical protein